MATEDINDGSGGIPGIDLSFPLEFFLEDVPLSLQASAASKGRWREKIAEAARATFDASCWLTEAPVSITIYYFPAGPMAGDVDNIVKPIIDALIRVVYLDDRQVDRVVVQKFEPERTFVIDNPSPVLAQVLETERPVVYIRLDSDGSATG